ncbi:bestrophin family protein [Cedecea neteri]|uniref:bestrophin family protein n=1 Tax=Cedecea neteri TaxID=158822 RepID=UPI0004F7230B|nr:bestrophin family ion channel [Cedecea neteri]AIR66661.1 hypothetical protein LH86_16680 [Cedecea neteri]
MIVRPPQHWLARLFVWHGSVLEKIYSRLLLNLLLSISVIFFLPWYETLGIKLTIAPFSILGVAIAIFLGFRNSACYARFNEARLLWGQLAITSRSLLREVKTLAGDQPEAVQRFVNLQVAFCNSLRMTLRKKPQQEMLSRYLNPQDLAWVSESHAPCNRILMLMGSWLNQQRENGVISDVLWRSLDNHLNELSAVSGGCERIMSTPMPFAYSLIQHRTVYIFCIMLPFALVTDLHYMTPFVSVFVSYTFISLDSLAEELEDPFGTEDNDLPLDAICVAIERDLRDMNDETEKPEALKPNRHYRLS